MDIRDMECLLALEEHKSYTKAAEQLYMSQPALSRRIQHLSLELGVDLVDRSDGELRFTKAGMLYLDYCREAIENNNNIIGRLNKLKSGEMTEIRVAYTYAGTNYLLPAIISQLQMYPNTNFKFMTMRPTADISKMLINNEIDIAVGIRSEFEHYANVNVRTFLNMRYGFAASVIHPYFNKDYLSTAELMDQDIMLFKALDSKEQSQHNYQGYHIVANILTGNGISPNRIFYSKDIVSLSCYAATGKYLIFSNFNTPVVRTSAGLLRVIPWNDIEFTGGDLMVAWRKDDPIAETFANTIINCDYHSFLSNKS